MPFPTVTYTFTNSTTADATQVNQNFTDLINGISDGTKNISVSAMSAAGATSLNAAVTLGASSANDLVFNGSIASTIPVKTNTTYNIGSATLGLLGVYIGGSSTFTVRLLGATMASSYTLTLPPTTGTIGQFPVTDGSGVLTFRYPDKAKAAQTSNVTLTGDETLVPCSSAAGTFTVTLPAAASFTGKRYVIIKTDGDTNLANKVTVAANGAELINGSNTTSLNTQYESIEIVCDGTGWHIINRRIPSAFATYTMTPGATTSAPTKGTVVLDEARWRRVGDSIQVRYNYSQSAAGAAGTGTYLYPFPTGLTADTTKLSVATAGLAVVGNITLGVGGAANTSNGGVCVLYNSTNLALFYDAAANSLIFWSSTTVTGYGSGSNTLISFEAMVPISGWNS